MISFKQFVENKNIPKVLWHISNHKFTKFNKEFAAQGIFWFAKNKTSLINDLHGASITYTKPIYLYKCTTTCINPAGWDEYDKLGLGQIEDKGYDSIDLGDDFIVFDAKNIKILNIEKIKR